MQITIYDKSLKIILTVTFLKQLEMWAISNALPFEAARAPSPSACQVSAQSRDARLSYSDFTDFFPQRL